MRLREPWRVVCRAAQMQLVAVGERLWGKCWGLPIGWMAVGGS